MPKIVYMVGMATSNGVVVYLSAMLVALSTPIWMRATYVAMCVNLQQFALFCNVGWVYVLAFATLTLTCARHARHCHDNPRHLFSLSPTPFSFPPPKRCILILYMRTDALWADFRKGLFDTNSSKASKAAAGSESNAAPPATSRNSPRGFAASEKGSRRKMTTRTSQILKVSSS